jgi:hypothetical protein
VLNPPPEGPKPLPDPTEPLLLEPELGEPVLEELEDPPEDPDPVGVDVVGAGAPAGVWVSAGAGAVVAAAATWVSA